MDKKFFDEMEKFIAEKIKVNTSAIDVTAASIETAKADKEKAEKKAEQALNNGDVDGYQKAQKAIEKADAIITVHGNLLKKLKEEPILPKGEYESKVAGVLAEIEKTVSANKEKIISLIDQMADIRDADDEIINRGNDILKKLQHDLYRDADRSRDKFGRLINLRHEEKRFDELNIPSLVNSTLNNDCYKAIGGTRKVVSNSIFTSGITIRR